MVKKVIVIGNGAREHAIGEMLMKTGKVELFTYGTARNPGLMELSTGYELGPLEDVQAMTAYAKMVRPDFVVPGPEVPIAAGIVDALETFSIPCVAPKQTVARVESSKGFTRHLLEKYNIPGNPLFQVFTHAEGIEEYLRDTLHGQFVIKADGLKGGKGVKVVGDHLKNEDDGLAYATECLLEDGHVVVEEKLIGQEFSLMSFIDDTTVLDMIPVQDHKRAFVNDKGPNTGGMGSYSDANHLLPFLTKADVQAAHDITVQVAEALKEETGVPFKGVLYGGFIAVKDGIRLIEYNARFGDPEILNVLSLLKNDFLDVCQALIAGELKGFKLEFEPKASVCKYVVPEGYPDHPKKNEKVEIPEPFTLPEGVQTFYASVDRKPDGLYLAGSRAVAFVGLGDTLKEAEYLAQAAASKVRGSVFFREDIGTETLIAKRVEMLRELRSS